MGLLSKIKLIFIRIFSSPKKVSAETKIVNPYIDSEAIAALSSASIKLENKFGIKSTGKCGICVKDVNLDSFREMKKYVEDFLVIVSNEQKKEQNAFSFETFLDEYQYLWFVLKGKSIEDLVAGINAVGDTIHEKGFSRQILGAVFEFTSGYESRPTEIKETYSDISENKISEKRTQYLIYNYKSDKFYPFVPVGPILENGKRKRDNQMEFNIMDEISNEISFQKDYSQWYPIWNIPL